MIASNNFEDLLALMARLRTECPWDAKQTNDSLIPYAIEEVYELVDAINQGELEEIKGELGDVLLQVVFHAHLYDEQGAFDMGDVIKNLMEKLIRRHPHIFDAENLKTPDDVKRRWDEIKAIENQGKPKRLLSAVKAGSGLMQAQDIQKTASKVGFDWDGVGDAFVKFDEEVGELKELIFVGEQAKPLDEMDKQRLEEELGDCFFALVNVARKLNLDAEKSILTTVTKFKNRFVHIEDGLAKAGLTPQDASLEQMDQLWEDAKKSGL